MMRRSMHTAVALGVAAALIFPGEAPAQPAAGEPPAVPDAPDAGADPAPDESTPTEPPPAEPSPTAGDPAAPADEPDAAAPDGSAEPDPSDPPNVAPAEPEDPAGSAEPPPDEPPPTETTAELLAADSFALGPGYGAGTAPPLEEEDLDDRPWGQGTIVPGIGIGFGFGGDQTVLSFGLGASYYVIDGLAVGLNLGDTIYIYSDELDEAFPGFSDQIPTNVFRITPTVQYVFYRHETFSPYVLAGVGPVFYNNGGGVVGEWVAGPGIFIVLGGPVALDLGLSFSSKFPEQDWEEAFSYDGQRVVDCAITDSLCSFDISPHIGIVLSF